MSRPPSAKSQEHPRGSEPPSPFIKAGRILFILCITLGILLRLGPLALWDSSGPVNLSGLFTLFCVEIKEHNFLLPETIPYYTPGGIPFGYFPLAFYVGALALSLGVPELLLSVLLTNIVGVFSLLTFWFLAKELAIRPGEAQVATAIFAVCPGVFLEVLRGEGMAEAWGMVLLPLYFVYLIRFGRDPTVKSALVAGIIWALTVLASPGSAALSILVTVIFCFAWLIREIGSGQVGRFIAPVLVLGVSAVVLTAPWWLTVVVQHGFSLFTGAFTSQSGQGIPFLSQYYQNVILNRFQVSGPVFWTYLLAASYFAGLLMGRWREIAFVTLALMIPRETSWLTWLFAPLLISAMVTALAYSLAGIVRSWEDHKPQVLGIGVAAIFSVFILLLVGWNAWSVAVNDPAPPVYPEEIAFGKWIAENLPEDAQLILLTRERLRETLPFFAQRTVINTMFGAEWQPEEWQAIQVYNRLRLPQAPSLPAARYAAGKTFGAEGDYYVINRDFAARYNLTETTPPGFRLIYDNEELRLYALEK